jgi:hypothetical protein
MPSTILCGHSTLVSTRIMGTSQSTQHGGNTQSHQNEAGTPPGGYPVSINPSNLAQAGPSTSRHRQPVLPGIQPYQRPGSTSSSQTPASGPSLRCNVRPQNLTRPSSSSTRSAIGSVLNYFIPISTPDITHEHDTVAEDRDLVAQYLLIKGLLPELVPRVLDIPQYWSCCTRGCSREVGVGAGTIPPRKLHEMRINGTKWLSGQEDELKDVLEIEGSDLKDEDGKTWYLVSEPIGCGEGYVEVDEEGEVGDGIRLGGRPPSAGSFVMVNEDAESGPSHQPNDPAIMEDSAAATMSAPPQPSLPLRKAWLRKLRVETLSKDQGWSTSGTEHYGGYPRAFPKFLSRATLIVCRDLRSVVYLVRAQPVAQWQGSRGFSN